MKVAREGTIVGGALLALCCLNFGAVAFETAPVEAPPSISNSILPEFLDSSRVPKMQDAWRSSVTRESSSSGEAPAVADPPTATGQQPVRRRAEELSGRFSDGASASNPSAKRDAKPAPAKEPPTSLTEAAMPGSASVMSHMGAPVAVPAEADQTTTATLPDVATDKPPTAETAPDPAPSNAANATWLKVGLPPLPLRSPKSAKAHAKAITAKSRGDKSKASEKPSGEKSGSSKSTAGKVATAKEVEKDDEDEKPVRQFRAPAVRPASVQPRVDPGRKEVFPPYLGAYGLSSQAR